MITSTSGENNVNDILNNDNGKVNKLPLVDFIISPISKNNNNYISPTTVTSSCLRYPNLHEGMTTKDFEKWTMIQLQGILADRCINKTGNKVKLVENAFGAYSMNLPVNATDAQQEQTQIKEDVQNKLLLDNGMVIIPNPLTLKNDWK